ncbi:MAG: carbohydrate binding domain-containing protein [Planctomycetota bacterium]
MFVVAVLLVVPVYAQHSPVEEDWFEFVIPTLADAGTTGTPIDLSVLNTKPAGGNGFLRSDDQGRIVDGAGNVVRLFGTNICDWHAMPPKELAPRIADRLAQLGVNFIRLHYYDWTFAPEGILAKDGTTADPGKLDQLHKLVAELKWAGIYVDINLHVARRIPGTPESWPNAMSKGIDRVVPALIEDQKRFAESVLLPVNPYTGLALIADPAVAVIEINNENSLMAGWWTMLGGLPAEVGEPLRVRWNDWIARRYDGTEALRMAWNTGLTPRGANVLRNGDLVAGMDGWDLEAGGGAVATADVADGVLTWAATQPGANEWSHQLHQTSLPVEHGKDYVLRFRARRVAGDGDPRVRLMHQQAPWNSVSSSVPLRLTRAWQTFELSWRIDNPSGTPVRLSFDLLNQPMTVELAEISLAPGALPGLREGESLEARNIPMPGVSGNGNALADFRRFCMELELEYTAEMVRFLREDLGAQAMLLDTQVNYGGGVGLVRERTLTDIDDLHGYPTHPQDVTGPDGVRTWRVEHKSFVGEAFENLPGIARWQAPDRPLFLTEFDMNPPSPYSAEIYPMLAVMSAYQGWDAIGEYAWLNFQTTYEPTASAHPFHTSGVTHQVAFMPTAALLYRNGLVREAQSSATLTVHEQDMLEADLGWTPLDAMWQAQGFGHDQGFRQKLLLELVPGSGAPTVDGTPVPGGEQIIVSDTGEIRLDRTIPGRERMVVNTPQAKLAIGHTLGAEIDWGNVGLTVDRAGGRNDTYANVTLVALDDTPVDRSDSLLLTVVSTAYGAGWEFVDEELTTVRMGPGPMRVEPTAVTLTLPGDGWALVPLDGSGRPMDVVVADDTADDGQSVLNTAGLESVWFHLVRM